ncbi:hypothetical protein [Streptomyces sp. SAI-041]|uniref:hypothetical protein n=1 Tax=Streptomyces sp. SAI-041 TaxID=2940548 RepID=UPI00247330F6|nr:hypothetical protein [Streptomyces sp. SAI-041]MDH6549823.1 hypothetical protein [Streptomyces sp. SAI-041]
MGVALGIILLVLFPVVLLLAIGRAGRRRHGRRNRRLYSGSASGSSSSWVGR